MPIILDSSCMYKNILTSMFVIRVIILYFVIFHLQKSAFIFVQILNIDSKTRLSPPSLTASCPACQPATHSCRACSRAQCSQKSWYTSRRPLSLSLLYERFTTCFMFCLPACIIHCRVQTLHFKASTVSQVCRRE